MSDGRRTNQFAVLLTDQLRAALDHAAERRFTTPSEYIRQAVVEKMRADHIEPTQIHAAGQMT